MRTPRGPVTLPGGHSSTKEIPTSSVKLIGRPGELAPISLPDRAFDAGRDRAQPGFEIGVAGIVAQNVLRVIGAAPFVVAAHRPIKIADLAAVMVIHDRRRIELPFDTGPGRRRYEINVLAWEGCSLAEFPVYTADLL